MRQGRHRRLLIHADLFNPQQGPHYAGPCFYLGLTMLHCRAGLHAFWLALLLVLLPGCSTIRIVYNQADTVLAWMADDYFDLTTAQKQDFHTRINRLLTWHRHEQLPDYVRWLEEIKLRSQRTLTHDDATWLIDNAKARYRVIAQQGSNDAADMLTAMTADNIRALEKQFAKVNQKFTREHKLAGTAEARRKERLERTLKRIREWTGPLNAAQEARIAVLNETIPDTDHLRNQERLRRQKEFYALLNMRNNKAEFTRALVPWLADWDKGRPAEVQLALNNSYEKRIALYLEVERMLTAQQRTHMQQRIQSYIEDLHALAARRAASN